MLYPLLSVTNSQYRIHKKITNNELNKDILLNILNNNYDEDDIKYILDNLYYLNENNIIKTLKKFYDNNTTIKTYLIPYAILTSYIPHYRENNIYINIAKEIIKEEIDKMMQVKIIK